jgi:hypothetical protein
VELSGRKRPPPTVSPLAVSVENTGITGQRRGAEPDVPDLETPGQFPPGFFAAVITGNISTLPEPYRALLLQATGAEVPGRPAAPASLPPASVRDAPRCRRPGPRRPPDRR